MFSTVVSALVATFKPAKISLGSARYSKIRYCCPHKIVHHLSSFFFSKPSANIANVGNLLWAQTSYIVFVWVQVYLWLPKNIVAWSTLRICVHCRMPFYIAPPFLVTPTLIATAWLSFSVELAGWAFVLFFNYIDRVLTAINFVAYHLLLCSRTTHTKLLTCYSYMMATRILRRLRQCCRKLMTSSSHCCLCVM